MENTVVFIRELKRLDKTSRFPSRQFALLLDHSVLYHFVLNQRDSSAECSAMLANLLTKLTDKPLYLPKFPLPELRVQDKERSYKHNRKLATICVFVFCCDLSILK
jgi:hypothetical protein